MNLETHLQLDCRSWSFVLNFDIRTWFFGACYDHGWWSIGIGPFGLGMGGGLE